ncbi:MAG: rod shape-determining protein MreC [Acidimicrobiaceae bacterium]|nr:rod shape-determining protein MreC [Acidimicrobiaceae bacterium]
MASDRTRRRIFFTGVIGTLIILTVYVTGGVVAGARGVARAVVSPFSWAADFVARPVGHLVAGMVNYSDIVAQNQQLRYLLGQATLRADENASAAQQLRQLSQALHVPVASSLGTVMAQVTEISPTNFSDTVTIGKGQDEGVMDGMPVVADGGLVGRIIATSAHSSTVRLLNDTGSVVGATFGNGLTSVLISGQGINNPLSVTQIPVTAALGVGSLLSTSGLQGGLFPPGLPVGRVTKLLINPGSSSYSVSLAPTANLNNLAYVDVVLWEPST